MNTWKIAMRNIFRNRRRSLMTISAIAVGAIAMLLFGGFVRGIELGLEVMAVQRDGHLLISRAGFFDFGSGNPGTYAIHDYEPLLKLIGTDPVLRPMVAMATPKIQLYGVAGNFAADRSQTFMGSGFVPVDRARMLRWDEYHLEDRDPPLPVVRSGLKASEPDGGVLGGGLARMLDLCQPLHVAGCKQLPPAAARESAIDPAVAAVSKAVAGEQRPAEGRNWPHAPRIDLLAATTTGAPNVVSLHVLAVEPQTIRELDDVYVAMPLRLAQTLLFGRPSTQATGVVIQLHHTRDLALARRRLAALFGAHHLTLEMHDFWEIEPINVQVIAMFNAIFAFMAVIIAVIVIFMVTNTMTMSVVERTVEIGTIRALGLRRSGVRFQFLAEGCLLGIAGGSIGVALGFLAARLLNHAHITWLPPMNAQPVPFISFLSIDSPLVPLCWISLVLLATTAALLPANRAARMEVVEALRHV